MPIFIRDGKGKKDRYTLLSKKILLSLSDYYTSYNPKCYLFEGEPGTPYSASSAGQIFKRGKKAQKLTKISPYIHCSIVLLHHLSEKWYRFTLYTRITRSQKPQNNDDLYPCN